jgi:catechol 2,3-dioxygenase-like lactoylglutathione lyase family enzyme
VLDHLSIQCDDPAAAIAFYDAVLPTIGGGRVLEFDTVIGYGVGQKPDFWVGPLADGAPNREVHIAFEAPDRAAVRAFFDAAVAAGAEVLHEPQEWPIYHPGYYGGFVRDPDGNNVEAVCHRPE